MSPKNENSYKEVSLVVLPQDPAREHGVVITEQDLLILREGGRVEKYASHRNTALSALLGSGVGLVGVVAPLEQATGSSGSIGLSALASVVVLGSMVISSSVLTWWFHRMAAQEKNRDSYGHCLRRIERGLGGGK